MYLYGAAAKVGLILAPLNFRLAGEELQYALTDSGARALVVDAEHLPVGCDLAEASPHLEWKYVIGEPADGFLPFADLLAGEHPDPGRLASADDGLLMIHTAAVEVHPRGVLLSQRNLLTANVGYQYNWAITPEDVHLCLLPLFHILGLGMALAALQAGCGQHPSSKVRCRGVPWGPSRTGGPPFSADSRPYFKPFWIRQKRVVMT